MARTRFVPEYEKPERRYGKDDPDFKTAGFDTSANDDADTDWEFQSVENFVEQVTDEDRDYFTTAELVALAQGTGIFNTVLRHTLEGYGLKLRAPDRERNFATFGTNQHDRWTCEEARRMNGGGGGGAIMGMVD